jgi:putative transcriptional regulator
MLTKNDEINSRPRMNANESISMPDVYAIRRSAGQLTQAAFADSIGVPVKTLRNWEQRRREPTGPARVLLALIARNPSIVQTMLRTSPTPAA